MFRNIDPEKIEAIMQRAMDIIQNHKSTLLRLKLSVEYGEDGVPHVNVRDLVLDEEWQQLPDVTFRGEGKFRMLDRTEHELVIYYQVKAGSYFVKHSVECAFTLHVNYGEVSCTVNNGNRKKGETGEAEAHRLHQLCFPVDTGMTITFHLDLPQGSNE